MGQNVLFIQIHPFIKAEMKLNFKKWPCCWELDSQPAENREYYWNAGGALSHWNRFAKRQYDFRDIHVHPCVLKRIPPPFCSLMSEFLQLSPLFHNVTEGVIYKFSKMGNRMIYPHYVYIGDWYQAFSRIEGRGAEGHYCRKRSKRNQKKWQTSTTVYSGQTVANITTLMTVCMNM